jgi:3-oxoacyl-[acyl-carrier-protein] synthase III
MARQIKVRREGSSGARTIPIQGRTSTIIGTGSYLPRKIVTNIDLHGLISNFDIEKARGAVSRYNDSAFVNQLSEKELYDLWAKQLTGNEKRHFYDKDFDHLEGFVGPVENMGAEAGKKALEMAGLDPSELDEIIVATFTPELEISHAACSVARILGAENASGFTLNTACHGFMTGLIKGHQGIKCGDYRNVLVIASEQLTKKVNFNDPSTISLFADGAGAAVLQTSSTGISTHYSRLEPSDHIRLKDSQGEWDYIEMPGGKEVLRSAITSMVNASKEVLETSGTPLERIKLAIPHQGNGRIITGYKKRMKFPESKVVNVMRYIGNPSGASVPISLDMVVRASRGEPYSLSNFENPEEDRQLMDHLRQYRLEEGDKVLLTAVAGGYTYGAMLIDWTL